MARLWPINPSTRRETKEWAEDGGCIRIAVRRAPAVIERQERVAARQAVIEPQTILPPERIPVAIRRKCRRQHPVVDASIRFGERFRAFLAPIIDGFLDLLLFLRQFRDGDVRRTENDLISALTLVC